MEVMLVIMMFVGGEGAARGMTCVSIRNSVCGRGAQGS